MQEDFLHYVWKFQKFETSVLKNTNGRLLYVNSVGFHNTNSGPDFFNSQIVIEDQLWAGNVEIHIKSSDWYLHQHQKDVNYDNVILHVVWEHDAEIFRNDNSIIPTLELKHIVASYTLAKYRQLFSGKHKWIYCENDFAGVDEFHLNNWLDILFIERLEQKSNLILNELRSSKNHWEALLFRMLCKNFGAVVNREAFIRIGRSIDFSVIKKCSYRQFDLESILMGQAGLLLLEKEDGYYQDLQKNYSYLKHKFNLKSDAITVSKFFRLRPSNFPTIRLSQLASLYSHKKQLFSEVILDVELNEPKKAIDFFYHLFDESASDYWHTHFNFGVISTSRRKRISKEFIENILINTIIPLRFCYAKHIGKDNIESILKLASIIPREENTIIKKFNELRPIAFNSLDSQALLQLKNEYCTKMKCLECSIGNSILKG